jgi:nucleotide-binding universal stress UspA family protein
MREHAQGDQMEGGPTMKRILVATDGSAAAREAVEFGIDLAKHEGGEVLLVHVAPLSHMVSMNGFGLMGSVPYEPTRLDEKVLDDAKAVAEEHGVPATTELLRGDPADEIVAYANTMDIDLIVVGSRGHRALASALLGSVSRGILAHSKRPVLIVRAATVREPAVA